MFWKRKAADSRALDMARLGRALDELAAEDPRRSQLVKLRYFEGLGISEAAKALGISRATAVHETRLARVWIRDRLMVDSSATAGR